jgi:hypothetical protein
VRKFRFDESRQAFELLQQLLKMEKQVEATGPGYDQDWSWEIQNTGQDIETLWNDMHILARIEFVQAVVAELILKKEDEPS